MTYKIDARNHFCYLFAMQTLRYVVVCVVSVCYAMSAFTESFIVTDGWNDELGPNV